jgi:hypothetical protein
MMMHELANVIFASIKHYLYFRHLNIETTMELHSEFTVDMATMKTQINTDLFMRINPT